MLDVVWENKMKCTLVVVTVWLYLVTQNNKVNQEIYVLVTFCPTITNNVCAAVNGKWSGSVKKINYFHSMISSWSTLLLFALEMNAVYVLWWWSV